MALWGFEKFALQTIFYLLVSLKINAQGLL
jgi:hypothetical protein